MVRKISIPIGNVEVTTSTASVRETRKLGSKEFAKVDGITFVRPGQKVVLRAIDGIIIATDGQHMVVANTQDRDIIGDVIREFERRGVSAGKIDMFVQFPTSGTEGILMDQARQAGIRSSWVMHSVAESPSGRRKQKYVMVKRSA